MGRVWAWIWILLLGAAAPLGAQDWPTLRGGPERTGAVDATWPAGKPARIWVRHFANERLGSAMEPIVGGGLVFVATHTGNLYALHADTGEPAWRFETHGPILHSPCYAAGKVVVGSTDGRLYALDAATGKPVWDVPASGGFSAAPAIADGLVFVGSREGTFLAVDLESGNRKWMRELGAPIRQTAAISEGRIFVTAEDLCVRALDAKTGEIAWTSASLPGQTARDFYPVVVRVGARKLVVVRTNPVIHHPDRLSRDFQFLARNAGVEGDWKKIDAWMKGDQARGTPELWEKEQAAVVGYLGEHPEARCFFVFDAATGKEAAAPPVLWIGGCQGVPTPPVVLPGGRLQVFYRTAYTNWNHGVAPFVALGALDLETNRIVPWFHESGKQPPWNTFWGTADEAQNFLCAGPSLLIVHQSTLSRFDLNTRKLEALAGERDGWGGFRNLPWALNEWNGPSRGGVAISGKRLYWITGSRVLAFETGVNAKPAGDVEIDGAKVPTQVAGATPEPAPKRLLGEAVEEVLSKRWAPLYVQQGIGGREFFFDESSDLFESLALAYPHLQADLQKRVKDALAAEWAAHPPYAKEAILPLGDGERRERFAVPKELLVRAGHQKPFHPFGATAAVCLYAERCGEEEKLHAAWPALKANFEDFVKSGWQLDPAKGHLHANRYLASLRAFARRAVREGEKEAAQKAEALAVETAKALAKQWTLAADRSELRVYKDISEFDGFIIKGAAGVFLKVIPHNHKLGLFHDLTPDVAAVLRQECPESVEKIWKAFELLCSTWWLMGEEHQVHYGENFIDPPDFARDSFEAAAWLGGLSADKLRRRTDVPFSRADLSYVRKLAIVFEQR